MKLLGALFKLIVPIISAVLGLVVANEYNFFATLSFVPQESAYDVCIAAYFAIADLIISEIIELIKTMLKNARSEVEVIVSAPKTVVDLHNCPAISFNSEGIAEIRANVRLKGKKRHYKDMKIVICDTGFITLQPSARTQGIGIGENGDYIMDLDAITGNGSTIDINQAFRIIVKENIPDGTRTMKLEPNINKQNLWIKYNCNYAIIKAGGR